MPRVGDRAVGRGARPRHLAGAHAVYAHGPRRAPHPPGGRAVGRHLGDRGDDRAARARAALDQVLGEVAPRARPRNPEVDGAHAGGEPALAAAVPLVAGLARLVGLGVHGRSCRKCWCKQGEPAAKGNGHCPGSEIATRRVLEKGNDRNERHGRGDDRRRHGDAPVRGRLDQPAGGAPAAGRVRRQRGHGRRGRPALRGHGRQRERLSRAHASDVRGDAGAQGAEAPLGELLPRGRARALPARRPGRRGRRGRDVRHGHQHQEGAEGGRGHGHREDVEGPGRRHLRRPRLRGRGALRRAARRPPHALPAARRHLREAPPFRARGADSRGRRDRLRLGGVEARAGRGRRRHRGP